MNIKTKSISNIGSLSIDRDIKTTANLKPIDKKAKSLTSEILKDYTVEYVGNKKSFDIPNAWFTNKINMRDVGVVRQVQHVFKLDGKSFNVDKLPIYIDDSEDSFLYNRKTDLIKKSRFDEVRKKYRLRDALEKELRKFPYNYSGLNNSDSALRIICSIENKTIKIQFIDIHHLLATKMIDASEYTRKAAYCDTCISKIV